MKAPCSLCVPPLNVVRQRKKFPAVTNTHATIEKVLDAVFSMRSVSYE
jgi:hypothetical protein